MSTAPVVAFPAAQALKRNILAVASGKGGVGKTWFSITLAHALARAGSRSLLFDGDLGLANVDVQLGVTPERDLASVIAGQISLDQAVTHCPAGFDIVAGRSGSGSLATLPANRLLSLRGELQDFAQRYDWAVLDLGAGIERTVRLLAAQSRACLVVTTDEPTAITDAYAYIKLAHAARPSADIRVVVNMAASEREGERTYQTILKACQNFLKISPPLAGIVRRDPRVAEAIRHQAPILSRHPNCDAADDVARIAEKLSAAS